MPDEKSEKKSTGLESVVPRWDKIDEIATEVETIFFDKSAEKQLSPYEMSIIVNRMVLLFEEYKLVHFVRKYSDRQQEHSKTIHINGKDSIYR